MSLVERGGVFLIGIYAKGPKFEKHLAMKKAYNRAGPLGKKMMIGRAITKKMWKRLKRGQNPLAWNQKRARGMTTYHDIVDWHGGLPYDAATAEEMEQFFAERGFTLEKSSIKRDGGVSVYLFRSAAPRAATA
jgi:2-polyprenyl-6-hydroxyphenyl methylase/3-demethylubiquinone-9 3-methyltransferase